MLNHKLTTIVKSQNILDLLGNEATMVPSGGNNNQTSTSNPAHHDILDLIFDLNPDGASTGELLMHFVRSFIYSWFHLFKNKRAKILFLFYLVICLIHISWNKTSWLITRVSILSANQQPPMIPNSNINLFDSLMGGPSSPVAPPTHQNFIQSSSNALPLDSILGANDIFGATTVNNAGWYLDHITFSDDPKILKNIV